MNLQKIQILMQRYIKKVKKTRKYKNIFNNEIIEHYKSILKK